MKKVWPRDDQKAISRPNNKKRHSIEMNVMVLTAPLVGGCVDMAAMVAECAVSGKLEEINPIRDGLNILLSILKKRRLLPI